MLENEQRNSADRLASLEKRVQQQNDELICLKSALADVIRRINTVENSQHIHHQQQQLQQQQQTLPHGKVGSSKTPVIRRPPSAKDMQAVHSSSMGPLLGSGGAETVASKDNKPTGKSEKLLNAMPKAGSVEKLPQTSKTGHKALQALVDYNPQSINVNTDSGLVKFYLRGRPINLYLPNSYQVSSNSNEIGFKFDTEVKIKAPKEQLKLEWVYGYRGINIYLFIK